MRAFAEGTEVSADGSWQAEGGGASFFCEVEVWSLKKQLGYQRAVLYFLFAPNRVLKFSWSSLVPGDAGKGQGKGSQ